MAPRQTVCFRPKRAIFCFSAQNEPKSEPDLCFGPKSAWLTPCFAAPSLGSSFSRKLLMTKMEVRRRSKVIDLHLCVFRFRFWDIMLIQGLVDQGLVDYSNGDYFSIISLISDAVNNCILHQGKLWCLNLTFDIETIMHPQNDLLSICHRRIETCWICECYTDQKHRHLLDWVG